MTSEPSAATANNTMACKVASLALLAIVAAAVAAEVRPNCYSIATAVLKTRLYLARLCAVTSVRPFHLSVRLLSILIPGRTSLSPLFSIIHILCTAPSNRSLHRTSVRRGLSPDPTECECPLWGSVLPTYIVVFVCAQAPITIAMAPYSWLLSGSVRSWRRRPQKQFAKCAAAPSLLSFPRLPHNHPFLFWTRIMYYYLLLLLPPPQPQQQAL